MKGVLSMNKKSVLKAAAAFCACAGCFMTMTAALPRGLLAAAEESPIISSAAEADALAELLVFFGYESITDLMGGTRTLPDVSHIKDLDGNNAANVLDAQYLLQFLQGQRMYAYEYSELDVTGDCILNSADAEAYLMYVADYRIQGLAAPFSGHGSLRTVDTSFENRSYWRYNCLTSTKDPNPYTVSSNTLLPSQSIEQNQLQKLNNSHNNRSFIGTEDQRFVQTFSASDNPGTGFIIGTHLIATAAHCVYNSTSNQFSFNGVKMYNYTYDNQGNIIDTNPVSLTPLSVHVPVAYANSTTDNDYALIEVSEDLSDYGFCKLGMVIDGIDLLYSYTLDGLEYVDESGADIKAMGYVPSGSYNPQIGKLYLPGTSYGQLYKTYNDRTFTTTADHASGESGGAVFIQDSSNTYNTVFGIHTHAHANNSNIMEGSFLAGGLLITRPILQFYYSNPTISYED